MEGAPVIRTAAVGILSLFLVGVTLCLVLQPEPAQASLSSKKVSELVDYVGDDDVALSLRLVALEVLRKKTDSTVEGELEKLATGSEFTIAVFATTALAKKKTTSAKKRLKGILTSTKLKKDVRKSAMAAMAAQFKSRSDLTYMQTVTASDSDLKAFCQWLKTNVYGL
jgi:hypothetical protein